METYSDILINNSTFLHKKKKDRKKNNNILHSKLNHQEKLRSFVRKHKTK